MAKGSKGKEQVGEASSSRAQKRSRRHVPTREPSPPLSPPSEGDEDRAQANRAYTRPSVFDMQFFSQSVDTRDQVVELNNRGLDYFYGNFRPIYPHVVRSFYNSLFIKPAHQVDYYIMPPFMSTHSPPMRSPLHWALDLRIGFPRLLRR